MELGWWWFNRNKCLLNYWTVEKRDCFLLTASRVGMTLFIGPGSLVLLQHISKPPNDMLAYVFPAVSTPAWKGESLLAESWILILNDVARFEALGKEWSLPTREAHDPDWARFWFHFNLFT